MKLKLSIGGAEFTLSARAARPGESVWLRVTRDRRGRVRGYVNGRRVSVRKS